MILYFDMPDMSIFLSNPQKPFEYKMCSQKYFLKNAEII